ncbi:hypothetical protein DW644_14120 [Clostridiales bacterium AM23-16LB]|nr:hypothetical protein DW644_14120 [Clostridiales bacterium AM23-16LB]
MTYIINQIYHVVMILIFMMMFMMIVCFALYMSATRKKKKRREADMYFQSLDRKDAKDFLDFEDIVDDMVVTNHHRTFIAAFKCRGFNLGTASSVQVASTLQGYLSFINTIKTPITYRQYFIPMSLDSTKSMYNNKYDEIEQKLFHLVQDYDELLEALNLVRGIDIVQEGEMQKRLIKLQEDISNMEWRKDHLKDQIDFMNRMFKEDAVHPSAEEAYLVEWSYNSNDYSIELSEEEIHKKAIQELDNLCNNMISTLGGSNVSAYRCKTNELIEMFYQHTHPLSSSEFKMDDVQNSEYFDEYVTSHDYDRKMRTAMEDSMVEEGAYLAGAMADALAEEMEILAEEKTEEAEGSVNEPAEDK